MAREMADVTFNTPYFSIRNRNMDKRTLENIKDILYDKKSKGDIPVSLVIRETEKRN